MLALNVYILGSVLLVGNPTETTEDKQAPLVAAHSNVLNGSVDNLRFTYGKQDGLS